MNVVAELQKLKQLKVKGPDPVWAERSRLDLLAYCRSTEQFQEPARPLFALPRFVLVGAPVMAAVVMFIVLAQSTTDVPSGGLVIRDGFPTQEPRPVATANLPLAQSVIAPKAPLGQIATVAPSKSTGRRVLPKSRRPLATTRLAVSVQSLPQARWVFVEPYPGIQARWVFSEPNGS